jgi:hypothetical protein
VNLTTELHLSPRLRMLGTISSFHIRFNGVERLRLILQIFPPCGATAQIGPRPPRFEVFRSHKIRYARTHTHTRPRCRFCELLSACRKDRYLQNSQQTQQTKMRGALSEIRSRDPSNQTALRPTSLTARSLEICRLQTLLCLMKITSDLFAMIQCTLRGRYCGSLQGLSLLFSVSVTGEKGLNDAGFRS